MSSVGDRQRRGTESSEPTLAGVSVVPQPEKPTGLTVVSPDEALKRAQPLPTAEELAIEGLTDDEWKAFEKALAER